MSINRDELRNRIQSKSALLRDTDNVPFDVLYVQATSDNLFLVFYRKIKYKDFAGFHYGRVRCKDLVSFCKSFH